MFKVHKNSMCETYSKLKVRRSGVFIVNSEQISRIVLVFFPLLNLKITAGMLVYSLF